MSKYFVTTSIAYINGEPHIGYGQECLGADVMARYHRQKGDDTFFLTGADEHGFSVQMKAAQAGMEPRPFVESLIGKFMRLKEQLNLSTDGYVRTTDHAHQANAKNIWMKAFDNGYIYKKSYSAVYCVGCESMLKKSDLVDGRCPNHPSLLPEIVEEENWFFRLSDFQEKLEEYFKLNPAFVQPNFRYNEIKKLLERGLEDVSISRPKEKLSWGIEVPNDANQVMYVWFDALTNYLFPKQYWPADLHVIGKDILRFHAALWPAMLMAAGYSFEQLPKKVHVHGFITVEGMKMSKTLGNVVKPQDLVDVFGIEATRYLMLRELSFIQDSDFSWDRMKERYNSDLVNNLGNLVQRTLSMIVKYDLQSEIINFKSKNHSKLEIDTEIEACDFVEALRKMIDFCTENNQLIAEKQPWALAKENKRDELIEVLGDVYHNIEIISERLVPFMPETAMKIDEQLKSFELEILFPRLS
ncbi:MAG: methionine--tRNA ligase [bacterium]